MLGRFCAGVPLSEREQLCTRALLSAPEASEKPRSCPVASDWKTASTSFVCGTAARAPSQLVLFSSSRFSSSRWITTLDVEAGSSQARSCVYMGTWNTDEVIVWIQSAQRRFPCFFVARNAWDPLGIACMAILVSIPSKFLCLAPQLFCSPRSACSDSA